MSFRKYVFCFALCLLSLELFAKPRHLIVTVHGISGDAKTFGAFQLVASQHLRQLDSHYDFDVINFEYPSSNDSADSVVFADMLGKKIESYFASHGGLQADDKISLVAHSQGGIISSIWYSMSALNPSYKDASSNQDPLLQKFSKYQIYAEHMDSFVALGVPFWGSKLAWIGTKLKALGDAYKDGGIKALFHAFGKKQLDDLTLSSDLVYNFRKDMIYFDQHGLKSSIQVRPLIVSGVFPEFSSDQISVRNISGFKSLLNYLGAAGVSALHQFGLLFGDQRYESDLAVMVPSSRLEFVYGQALNSDYSENDVLSGGKFYRTSIFSEGSRAGHVKQVFIDAGHFSLDPENFFGVANIPQSCVQLSNCHHPAYAAIINHLAHCDATKSQCLNSIKLEASAPQVAEKSLQGVTMEVSLVLPDDYVIEPRYLHGSNINDVIQFDRSAIYQVSGMANVEMYRPFEITSGVANFESAGRPDYEFAHPDQLPAYSENMPEIEYKLVRTTKTQVSYLGAPKNQPSLVRFHFTGIVKPTVDAMRYPQDYQRFVQSGVPFHFKVVLPGLKSRQVEAMLVPGLSTFVEVKMSQK